MNPSPPINKNNTPSAMIKIAVSEEIVNMYNKMKMKRAYKWMIFCVIETEKDLHMEIEATGDAASTFADFVEKMPKEEPRLRFSKGNKQ